MRLLAAWALSLLSRLWRMVRSMCCGVDVAYEAVAPNPEASQRLLATRMAGGASADNEPQIVVTPSMRRGGASAAAVSVSAKGSVAMGVLSDSAAAAHLPEEEQMMVVMRHGHRQDEEDPAWHVAAERPWDPPLSQQGREQVGRGRVGGLWKGGLEVD